MDKDTIKKTNAESREIKKAQKDRSAPKRSAPDYIKRAEKDQLKRSAESQIEKSLQSFDPDAGDTAPKITETRKAVEATKKAADKTVGVVKKVIPNKKAKAKETAKQDIMSALNRSNGSIQLVTRSGKRIDVTRSNLNSVLKKIEHGKIKDFTIEGNVKADGSSLRRSNHELNRVRGIRNRRKIKKTQNKIKQTPQKVKKTARRLKRTAKAVYKAVKAAVKVTIKVAKMVGKLVMKLIAAGPIGWIILAVLVAIVAATAATTSAIHSAEEEEEEAERQSSMARMTSSQYQSQVVRILLDSGEYSEDDVAAILSNWAQESNVNPTTMQTQYIGPYRDTAYISNGTMSYSPSQYIQLVNSGGITREQFMYDGVGTGLAQWTWYTTKGQFYDFAKEYAVAHNTAFDISNFNMQMDFFMQDMNTVKNFPYQHTGRISTRELLNSAAVERKAEVFCIYYEYGGSTRPPQSYINSHTSRFSSMQTYVQNVQNGTVGGDSDFASLDGHYFTQLARYACQTCAVANLYLRYYYMHNTPGWESFGPSTVLDNGKGLHTSIVSNHGSADGSLSTWSKDNDTRDERGWSPYLSNTLTYNGVTAHYVTSTTWNGTLGDTVRALLAEHPSGVLIYKSCNHQHAILVTRWSEEEQTFYYVDSGRYEPGRWEACGDSHLTCNYDENTIETGYDKLGGRISHYGYIETP